jgi:hypothetical protein
MPFLDSYHSRYKFPHVNSKRQGSKMLGNLPIFLPTAFQYRYRTLAKIGNNY